MRIENLRFQINISVGRPALIGEERLTEYAERLQQLRAEGLGSGCSARRYTLLFKKHAEEMKSVNNSLTMDSFINGE